MSYTHEQLDSVFKYFVIYVWSIISYSLHWEHLQIPEAAFPNPFNLFFPHRIVQLTFPFQYLRYYMFTYSYIAFVYFTIRTFRSVVEIPIWLRKNISTTSTCPLYSQGHQLIVLLLVHLCPS